jgi:hypothetical protein
MKKCILLLICVLFINSFTNAQYRINKKKYDYRTYSYQPGDPYSPGVALITSLILPGLGQMVSGEGGRGATFLGGWLVCATVFAVGTTIYFSDIEHPFHTGEGAGLMIAGGLGAYAVYIFGTIDAVRVAKVNNLVFRDKNKTLYIFQMQPFIAPTNYSQNPSIQTGITLKVRF